MQSLITIALTFVCTIILLSSEFSPWMVLKRSNYTEIKTQSEKYEKLVEEYDRLAKAVSGQKKSTGAWMYDAEYRTALEKTTVFGVPEESRTREPGQSARRITR